MFNNKEPAIFFNGIGQIFSAIIPVLIMFELIHWSDKQIAGIMFLVGVTIRVATTWFTRSNSVSIPTANRQIEIAVNSPVGTEIQEVVSKAKEG